MYVCVCVGGGGGGEDKNTFSQKLFIIFKTVRRGGGGEGGRGRLKPHSPYPSADPVLRTLEAEILKIFKNIQLQLKG